MSTRIIAVVLSALLVSLALVGCSSSGDAGDSGDQKTKKKISAKKKF